MARRQRNFEWRWLAFVAALVVAVAAAIIVNLGAVEETAEKIANAVDVDNGDLKINWDKYQTVDVELSESFTIVQAGTYHLTGTLEDGMITIDAGVSEVRLILDNVSIANSAGPAILCYNAEDLVIELVGENTLKDGANFASTLDEDVDGVIYSKADLAFTGDGTLNLTATHQDGIVGKDDVNFRSGNYKIVAADDGIRGKDSVYITGGEFDINAKGAAIKSNNEDDFGKGFIMVEGGEISAVADGKGLKAVGSILIYGGTLNLNTYDDAVHADNYLGIIDGDFTIRTNDDGLHADKELIIDGGKINIEKSYEGIEAQVITINGGTIAVVASDDGLNAGSSSSAITTSRMGAMDADESCILTINGGEVYVNAAGDGVDSNGYIYFNGGTVAVDGPTNSGNGALDAGAGIVMQGGTVVAVGASGMAETLGANSGVPNISVYFSSTLKSGTKIEIKNSAGETVLEHTAAKTFGHLAAGTKDFTLGQTYIIYINGEKYEEFTIAQTTTTIGNSNMNHNGGGMQRR